MTFLHSPQRLPGAGGKPATLRIHKTPGACGDLAEKKEMFAIQCSTVSVQWNHQ